MNLEEKNLVSKHLNDEIIRLGITTRVAAEWIGILPIYISMAKNPASFDSMSKSAWDALEKWHLSREPLDKYKLVEKQANTSKLRSQQDDSLNGLMDAPDKENPGKMLKKMQQPEKTGKSVKLVINQAEMAEMRKDIECLKRQVDTVKSLKVPAIELPDAGFFTIELEIIKGRIRKLEEKVIDQSELRCELFVIKDEDIPDLQLQIRDLTAVVEKIKGEKKDGCVVIFQRNIYKSHE